jgi:protein phosphatase 2C family protein 2/3
MFGHDDSDDDDSGDDNDGMDGGRSFFGAPLGLASPDLTRALKAKSDDFESDIHEGYGGDLLVLLEEADRLHNHTDGLQGEAPTPPKPLPNGDATPIKQLTYQPGGDEPSPAVKAEGLLDKSEDPLIA